MRHPVDILILSNGPGELATWVKPMVQALRQQLSDDRSQVRLSVVLSPCANASGQEAAIARCYPEVDRVQSAEHFFPFLLWGKTAEAWDWRSHGVVLFLGGDQFFPVVISRRLGYRSVIYAEWEARWHRWIDHFGVMRDSVLTRVPQKYAHKFTVVGDLMAEAGRGDGGMGGWEDGRMGGWGDGRMGRDEDRGLREAGEQGKQENSSPLHPSTPPPLHPSTPSPFHPSTPSPLHPSTPPPLHPSTPSPFHPSTPSPLHPSTPPPLHPSTPPPLHPSTLIGLLPGSKPTKLSLGVPLCLAIAEQVVAVRPSTRFVIPVAPSLSLETLAMFADPTQNAAIEPLGWAAAELVVPIDSDDRPFLKTLSGLKVELWTKAPAYELLAQCSLCLTTVGANTAELGALAVPMLVLIPLQQIDRIRTWDGIPGLLANLPMIGGRVATLMTHLALKRLGQLAWPNIWANAEIVPELAGDLQPQDVAAIVLDLLDHPEKLKQMQANLRAVRGQTGAATRLTQLVVAALQEAGAIEA